MPSQEFLEQHHYHKVELGQFMEEVEVSEIDKLLVEIATLKAKLEAMERWVRLDVDVAKMNACERAGDEWEGYDWTKELMSGQYDIWQLLTDETRVRIEDAAQETK